MGVTGLLPNLKEIQKPTSLENFRGKTLAVDTYGWLHRGLISCAQELCQDVPTRKYINSVMKKIDMLRYFGVEPYLVFDGAYLPTKAETAKERRLKREEAKAKADFYIKQGNKKLAWKEFMKAAGVTPQMAKSIMIELDKLKVRYVVAPYEADPQMVYLEKIGVVQGILSEDSDLLIFGCNRLITKLDDYGKCIEICRDDFEHVKSIPSLTTYTPSQLRLVAILSGCDYTKGVPGIGLKTAFTLVRRLGDIQKILQSLYTDGKYVPPEFESEAHMADIAFQYQKVFNPLEQCLETLNKVPEDIMLDAETHELIELCCGKTLEHALHVEICNGRMHPNTYETLISREQSLTLLKLNSFHRDVKVNGDGPILASRSRSAPKIGSIDSFFGRGATKTLQPPSAQIVKQANIASKSEEALTCKRKSTNLKTEDRVCDENASVSPCTKRVRRILELSKTTNFPVQSVNASSKFFESAISTSVLVKPKARWDISEDSEIPDEFSSSPSKVTTIQNSEVLQDKEVTVVNQPVKDVFFDVDSEGSEIDESPMKKASKSPQKRLIEFGKTLYERYLMRLTLTQQTQDDLFANKSMSKTLFEEKSASISHIKKVLVIPDLTNSKLTFSATDLKLPNFVEDKLDVDSQGNHFSRTGSNPTEVVSKRVTTTVNLQQFAYKG